MKNTATIKAENYSTVEIIKEPAITTGIECFDNFLSHKGGFVLTSMIFLTGSSGAGKTTFGVFLQKTLASYKTSFYSREMSRGAVKEQTDNINVNHNNAYISDNETCATFDEYITYLYDLQPKFVIVDSLQVIAREDYSEMSEKDASYMIISKLRQYAKEYNAVIVLIGHVNKDDGFAGVNTIMQMVDAHLEMIFDKKTNTRTIAWGQKNRKGPMGTLYYNFSSNGLEFLTEEEFKSKNNEKTNVSNIVFDTITSFVKNLDKKNKNYSAFTKEYNKEYSKLREELNKTNNSTSFLASLIKLVETLSSKYEI